MRQAICSRNNTARDVVEPISNVECSGTMAETGKTLLVTARMIIAPPFAKAALVIAARKLPNTITYNTRSNSTAADNQSMLLPGFLGTRADVLIDSVTLPFVIILLRVMRSLRLPAVQA